jgi:hypothetical protein
MKKYTGIALLFLFSLSTFAGNNWNPGQRKPFEDLRRPIVLKLSPFHFFDNQLSLTGEFFNKDFKRSTAITLNLIYVDNSRIYDVGTSLNVERRFFPRGFNPDTTNWLRNSARGFYFGLGVQLGYSEYNNPDETLAPITKTEVVTIKNPGRPDSTYTYKSETVKQFNAVIKNTWVAPHVSIGYQLVLWEALFIDVFVGGGIRFNSSDLFNKTQPELNEIFPNPLPLYSNPDVTSRYYKGIIPRVGLTLGIGL